MKLLRKGEDDMTPIMMYNIFKQHFAWLVPHIAKYKGNRKTGGIDIFLDDGAIFSFTQDPDNKKGWILKGADYCTMEGE